MGLPTPNWLDVLSLDGVPVFPLPCFSLYPLPHALTTVHSWYRAHSSACPDRCQGSRPLSTWSRLNPTLDRTSSTPAHLARWPKTGRKQTGSFAPGQIRPPTAYSALLAVPTQLRPLWNASPGQRSVARTAPPIFERKHQTRSPVATDTRKYGNGACCLTS